jgi:Ca2+-binding RTX toxin-like protein
VISGLGERDYVRGFIGWGGPDVKDWICGGTESDALHGDDGNDWIDGERGTDYVVGGEGQDRLFGSGGNDRINPHWGSDFVDGGEGADYIQNSTDRSSRWSSDTIHGGEGSDFIAGEGGLGGSQGSDALYGDAGNDRVVGTRSHQCLEPLTGYPDLVDGGPGYDRCWADPDDTVVNCEVMVDVGSCAPGSQSTARADGR